MAHDKCTGTWTNSKLGGVLEGNGRFEIFPHAGEIITGRHIARNSDLVGRCNGTVIRFCVIDSSSRDVICYVRGKITSAGGTDFIKGKFIKPLEAVDALEGPEITVVEQDGKKVVVAADDWTAEKPT